MTLKFNALVPPFDNVGNLTKAELETELALYFKLAGRATAQTAIFGTGAGAEGRLESTSNATKGKILIGTSAYEEAKNFLGIGTKVPTAYLQVEGPKAEPFQAAPTAVKVTGAEGGEASGEETAGEGSPINVIGGKGGSSTVVGFPTIAGFGGAGTFTAGVGGAASGANTQSNQGGKGGGFSLNAAAGGAALNSTASNLAGEGGTLTLAGGKGGSAEGTSGTRTGARGGSIIMEAGAGGTGATAGGLGGAVLLEGGKNNTPPTSTAGAIQLKAGTGATGVEGGKIQFITYKESSTVGSELEITPAGEYLFKNNFSGAIPKSTFKIGSEGNVLTNVVAPIEIPASKTYEVPSNVQGLFKENLSIQGTLNIQGRFDEVYTAEPESLTTELLRNNAVTEAKTELPEMVKLTGGQTITGEKIFKGQQQFEKISFVGGSSKEIVGLSNAVLEEGSLTLTKEQLFFGTTSNELKEVKISGKIENGKQFEETPDFAYNVLPEGGAAEIASIKSGATPSLARHRVLLLGNISTTETLTLLHEGAGLAENRFFFASKENVKLEPKQTILLWYAEGTKGAQSRWRDVGGSSWNFRPNLWAPVGVPYEIPSGKTYEVPAFISSLWRENMSVQGTLNVQGHLTEI